MEEIDYSQGAQTGSPISKFSFSQMSLKQIGKSILGTLGTGLAIAVAVVVLVFGILKISNKNYSYTIFKSKAELNYYATKDDLVKCLDNYIDTLTHGNSAMNGFALLEKCDKYRIDVRFAMAQAQVESHFGTTGVAAKTNSVFNVLAYDGRSAADMIKKGHSYRHPDESIEPYLRLLTEDYLVDGKTEMDMLDKYVNKDGKRYASSATYEQSLRNAFEQLTSHTNVSVLYSEYKKYKMICGK